tara:strand:- start:572 stop:835 length:264 start_codon:yes stop_codon:yes gene_type:complete
MAPMKLTDRAKTLNEWICCDDEFFENKYDVATHYHLLRLMMDDYWIMKPEYCVYINPTYLHLIRDEYLMKEIKKMKCRGCEMCNHTY